MYSIFTRKSIGRERQSTSGKRKKKQLLTTARQEWQLFSTLVFVFSISFATP